MGGCDEGQVVQFVLGELSVCVCMCVCMCGGLLLTTHQFKQEITCTCVQELATPTQPYSRLLWALEHHNLTPRPFPFQREAHYPLFAIHIISPGSTNTHTVYTIQALYIYFKKACFSTLIPYFFQIKTHDSI